LENVSTWEQWEGGSKFNISKKKLEARISMGSLKAMGIFQNANDKTCASQPLVVKAYIPFLPLAIAGSAAYTFCTQWTSQEAPLSFSLPRASEIFSIPSKLFSSTATVSFIYTSPLFTSSSSCLCLYILLSLCLVFQFYSQYSCCI
jgi:hypothetical protein